MRLVAKRPYSLKRPRSYGLKKIAYLGLEDYHYRQSADLEYSGQNILHTRKIEQNSTRIKQKAKENTYKQSSSFSASEKTKNKVEQQREDNDIYSIRPMKILKNAFYVINNYGKIIVFNNRK